MPPKLALLLTLGFIVYLFRRDLRESPNCSRALWIPTIWMFIIESRFVSQWLSLFGIHVGGVSIEEGSPVDAAVFFALILSGLYVLNQRRVSLSEVIRNNTWLAIFFGYCFIAIVWSDFPLVALKRWIKIAGHPIMVLVLLTEQDPEESVIRLVKRCSYLLLPLSVTFIKYFPEIGRGFSEWTGEAFNKGVTTNKNELGYVCLISGFFFIWNLLKTWQAPKGKLRRNELALTICFLVMTWWLLRMAQSSTSLVSLLVGALALIFIGLPFIEKRRIGTYVVVLAIGIVLLEESCGVYAQVLHILGKSVTLTDRTQVWHDVLQIPINPVLGAGFESFWLGERREKMWAKWVWHPNQAHNGYLETYLNLGIIGLGILMALILATFWKGRREVLQNFEFGRFRLGFLAAVLVYNWTEASFKALHPVWFMFYIIAMDYPIQQKRSELSSSTETINDAIASGTSGIQPEAG